MNHWQTIGPFVSKLWNLMPDFRLISENPISLVYKIFQKTKFLGHPLFLDSGLNHWQTIGPFVSKLLILMPDFRLISQKPISLVD